MPFDVFEDPEGIGIGKELWRWTREFVFCLSRCDWIQLIPLFNWIGLPVIIDTFFERVAVRDFLPAAFGISRIFRVSAGIKTVP